jgi:hypothetical protein
METTEFKVGDVVRIKRCWLNGVNEGLELEVIRIGGACVFTKPHPQIVDDEPAFVPRDIELVHRASASPAQEAWVPRKGDRVIGYDELQEDEDRDSPPPKWHRLGATVLEDMKANGAVRLQWDSGDTGLAHVSNLRPMPSGSAGTEADVCCGDCREPASTCRHSKPDPYAVAKSVSDAEHATWQSRNEQARKRNIAALARELDQPSAERRARLHPHEGRSDRVYGGRRWE